MPLLLEQVSPSSRIHMDILKFHSKSRSCFGILSSTSLVVQRLNVLELQVNDLRYSYDIQTRISSYLEEKWFNDWYTACNDYYHNYSSSIWELWSTIIFSIDLKLMVLDSQHIQFL